MSSNSSAVVLVVDDETSGFAVIKALLSREGYTLLQATSGQEALALLETTLPDVILMDVMMPEINGIETCSRIKADPDWGHIPIIMVTALDSKEDLARCLATGANDFISKPVNGVELRARVASMLRIKQQYDALKATMQLREDMANMVVHDLRNPIASVLLGSQIMLERNELPHPDLERLRRIYAAAQQLNQQVNDLLVMAKMESGKLILNQTDVDLAALISQISREFQDIVRSKRITLEIDVPEPNYAIPGDANLLHRLIDNLLANAIKFSPSNSRITLRIAYSTQPEHNLIQTTIQVIDEGIGISEDARQRIFDKFATANFVEGANQIGLGLTFCKLVAEAHGGKITATANQPQGAIFTVIL